jgi:CXXC-20-CXXC protein
MPNCIKCNRKKTYWTKYTALWQGWNWQCTKCKTHFYATPLTKLVTMVFSILPVSLLQIFVHFYSPSLPFFMVAITFITIPFLISLMVPLLLNNKLYKYE